MRDRILVDLRNIYRREEIERHGFAYASVGRPGRGHRRRKASSSDRQLSPMRILITGPPDSSVSIWPGG